MIKIIIVDDSQEKSGEVLSLISEIPEINNKMVDTCSDVISAKRLIEQGIYDLMILDIQLPNRFGEKPKEDGGITFLHELSVTATLKKPSHIIGLSSHESLIEKFSGEFQAKMWTLIQYREQYTEWKDQLKNKVKYIIQSKSNTLSTESSHFHYDIAIITALSTPELRAVLDLPANWQEDTLPKDPSSTYYKGTFRTKFKSLSVVASSCPQMGMTSATVTAMKLINYYKPKYLVMLGIAAGIKGKGDFGDILVSDLSWDYGSGKNRYDDIKKEAILEPDPRPVTLAPELQNKFSTVISEKRYLSDIQNSWRAFEAPTLKAYMGPIASGAAVLENIELIEEQIKAQQRKVVGIDMELYGVFTAAKYCSSPNPKCIGIKSICDFGDQQKSDQYQAYASFTSASYFYRFALDNL